jgi:hypothetical protein
MSWVICFINAGPFNSWDRCVRLRCRWRFRFALVHLCCYFLSSPLTCGVCACRQPFAWETSASSGELNFTPAMLTIHRNLFFANYGAGQSVDNDDGSSYYDIHHNVEYASGGLKSDYAGHVCFARHIDTHRRIQTSPSLTCLPLRSTTTQFARTSTHTICIPYRPLPWFADELGDIFH